MILRPTALESPVSLVELQIHEPYPDLPNQKFRGWGLGNSVLTNSAGDSSFYHHIIAFNDFSLAFDTLGRKQLCAKQYEHWTDPRLVMFIRTSIFIPC